MAQGWLFARPIPESELMRWLATLERGVVAAYRGRREGAVPSGP
jgi:hypothetical protein